jgi:hypothetical protein
MEFLDTDDTNHGMYSTLVFWLCRVTGAFHFALLSS